MGPGQGAAVLDDGSILRWGLSGEGASLPALPAERAVYSAVENGDRNTHRWAIMVGDPIPVEVTGGHSPTGRQAAPCHGRPDRRRDGPHLRTALRRSGTSSSTVVGPDGTDDRLPDSWCSSGDIRLFFDPNLHQGHGVGTWNASVTFTGSPFVTTTATTSPTWPSRALSCIVTSGPTTWRQSAHDGTLCFDVVSGGRISALVANDGVRDERGGGPDQEQTQRRVLPPDVREQPEPPARDLDRWSYEVHGLGLDPTPRRGPAGRRAAAGGEHTSRRPAVDVALRRRCPTSSRSL